MQGLHRNITSFPETEASVSSQKKEKKQRNTHCEFSVKIYMKQNMKKTCVIWILEHRRSIYMEAI